MKQISVPAKSLQPSEPGHIPVMFFAFIVMAAIFSNGCGRKPPAVETPASPGVDTNQTLAVPRTPDSAPVMVAASPDDGTDLKRLNHIYVSWIVGNRRSPKSFEEFVALSGVKFPPPPAGKKYVIDKNGFINYANN